MRKNLSIALLCGISVMGFGQTSGGKVSLETGKKKAQVVSKANSNATKAAKLLKAHSKSTLAYCTVGLNCTDDDVITNVTFEQINNDTSCSSGGYGDYTAQQATVAAGSSYPISVTVGGGWFERVSGWVDWDNSESFDADEFLGEIGDGSPFGEALTLSGEIAVPADTAPGSYRLRLLVYAAGEDNPASEDPCMNVASNYGEYEDYTIVVEADGPAGCLTDNYGQWPSATYTPSCNGVATAITTVAYSGEYSKVNVTEGVEYTFSSSVDTYLVTISDEAGTTVYAAGIGSATYTPTTSGVVRFYTHLGEDCSYANTSHSRLVKCGEVPPPPTEPEYGCEQVYDGEFSLANSVSKDLGYIVANDFFVPSDAGTFKLSTIKALLLPLASSDSDFSTFDISIVADDNGVPGSTVVKTFTGLTPVSVELYSQTFAGYNTYNVTLDLESYELPVDTAADTKYWLTVSASSASAQNIFWVGYEYTEGWATSSNYQSEDGGASWTQITYDGIGDHYESIWTVDAACEDLAVSNTTKSALSYYPSPVVDYLNISSKENITSVSVYNIAGQKVLNNSQLRDGKINMSSYAPGTYIVTAILSSGKVETFKVLKK